MTTQTIVTERANSHPRVEGATWYRDDGNQSQQALKWLPAYDTQFANPEDTVRNRILVIIDSKDRFAPGDSRRTWAFMQERSATEHEHTSDAFYLSEDLYAKLQAPSQSGYFLFALQNPYQVNRAIGVFDPRLPTAPTPDPLNIGRQLEGLKNLKDGWADGMQPARDWGNGYGKAPTSVGLDWLAQAFQLNYPDTLPSPHVYPTPEGGVSLEWSLGPHRASLEIDFETCQAEWHCLDLSVDASYERDLQLDIPQSWEWLVSEVRHLGDPAA